MSSSSAFHPCVLCCVGEKVCFDTLEEEDAAFNYSVSGLGSGGCCTFYLPKLCYSS